ncbi:MAG: alpha/beta hydrolase [Candidatus Nitrosocosmicus sp.]|nr:alpha/beta hydrolase [Candidatus Nitrosocosmicus sp.]
MGFYSFPESHASTQSYPFIASTRGSFDLADGTNIQQENLPSALNILNNDNCPGELTIYVHGVWASEQEAEEQTERVFLSLLNTDYDIPVIGFSWDSNTAKNPTGWNLAKVIANQNGQNLANFILEFKNQCPNDDLRIIAHSLGSKVVLSAIQSLYEIGITNADNIVKSVHLLGAAVDDEQVSLDKLQECVNINDPPLPCSGEAIESVVSNFYNFYDSEDNMLAFEEVLFDATPWNWFDDNFLSVTYPSPYLMTETDNPLGAYGKQSEINTPENYQDYNVTAYIGNEPDSDKVNGCDLEVNLRNYGWLIDYYYCTITKTGDNHFGYMGYRSETNPQTIEDTGAIELVAEQWRNEIN